MSMNDGDSKVLVICLVAFLVIWITGMIAVSYYNYIETVRSTEYAKAGGSYDAGKCEVR